MRFCAGYTITVKLSLDISVLTVSLARLCYCFPRMICCLEWFTDLQIDKYLLFSCLLIMILMSGCTCVMDRSFSSLAGALDRRMFLVYGYSVFISEILYSCTDFLWLELFQSLPDVNDTATATITSKINY